MAVRLDDFRLRQGCEPSRQELAVMQRHAAADSRARKTGRSADELRASWRVEAAAAGATPTTLWASMAAAAARAAHVPREPGLTVAAVIDALALSGSTWSRAAVMRAICDPARPAPGVAGARWAAWLEESADVVMSHCVDLDPDLP